MKMIKRILKAITLRRVLALVVVTLVAWLVVVAALAAAIHVYGDDDHTQPADVIIVLGSGLRRDGSPGDALYRRSVWASQLYHDGIAPAVICTGGTGDGQRRSEADACRDVLVTNGVPADVIYLEDNSHSTEQNALYAREIIHANGWQQAVLVTDSFHMFRANWIFEQYDIAHYRSPVPRDWVRGFWYTRHFTREILALHWHAFKSIFSLPVTSTSIGVHLIAGEWR
jgi:uncharacterized SAM-binding protein YcdF (DUF218 family)